MSPRRRTVRHSPPGSGNGSGFLTVMPSSSGTNAAPRSRSPLLWMGRAGCGQPGPAAAGRDRRGPARTGPRLHRRRQSRRPGRRPPADPGASSRSASEGGARCGSATAPAIGHPRRAGFAMHTPTHQPPDARGCALQSVGGQGGWSAPGVERAWQSVRSPAASRSTAWVARRWWAPYASVGSGRVGWRSADRGCGCGFGCAVRCRARCGRPGPDWSRPCRRPPGAAGSSPRSRPVADGRRRGRDAGGPRRGVGAPAPAVAFRG